MIWPDNAKAFDVFKRVGTKWNHPPMGGVPVGVQWDSIYPLMDRWGLSHEDWLELHDDLSVMEVNAILTMREFTPNKKESK